MLGIGIDYSIQMHARIEEEVIIDHSEHPIQESARNLGPALIVVTFDAIFAFAALRFAKVPMIRPSVLRSAIFVVETQRTEPSDFVSRSSTFTSGNFRGCTKAKKSR